MREGRQDRCYLRADVRERRAVGYVGGEDPGFAQRAAGRGRELSRGQVGRGATAGEDVRDDHVEGTRRHPLQDGPGIADVHPEPAAGDARRQLGPDESPQGRV